MFLLRGYTCWKMFIQKSYLLVISWREKGELMSEHRVLSRCILLLRVVRNEDVLGCF
jgi:hypothetical protein